MTDYTKESLPFRVKKGLRYVRLYGPRRTRAKVQGQYHMKKRFDQLPPIPAETQNGKHVGFIGCGNFAYTTLAHYLVRNHGAVIRGAMDIDIHRAASLFESYDLDYYTDDPNKILSDPRIDLVFVVSNHASHAGYASDALRAGKSVHIEKPHVLNHDELEDLCRAMDDSPGGVNLGFNRPFSEMGNLVKRYLDAEGGAAIYNWFVAGHALGPDHWYLDPREGGRVLGNLCHWTDFVYRLVPEGRRHPILVKPARAASSDADMAVSLVFGDGSIAAITFSAKGDTFEGVRERFAAHRGDTLLVMDDFTRLRVDVGRKRRVVSKLFRDQGHEATVEASYSLVRGDPKPWSGVTTDYTRGTAELFLAVKEALEEDQEVVLRAAS